MPAFRRSQMCTRIEVVSSLYRSRLGSSGPSASARAMTNSKSDSRLRYRSTSSLTADPRSRSPTDRRSARRTAARAMSRAADPWLAPGTTNSCGSGCSFTVSSIRASNAVTMSSVTSETPGFNLQRSSGLVDRAGTTGEGSSLSHHEKEQLFHAVVEVAKDRGRVICNTGTYNTDESIELTTLAQKAGADGALVVTPYYNRPPQRGLIAHFTAVARSTDLPIVLYNIPSRTACLIETDTVLRLASDVPNIVGVKDATSDFQAAVRIVKESPPDFDLYSGEDA